MPMTSSEEYRKDFDLDNPESPIAKKAFEVALDTRKFEIGLYWQRTAYFWALIAASFAGFLAVLATDLSDKSFYAFTIACVGFLFSIAWWLVNRGSKFWQENWENHVDLLAENVAGPIFKTILTRKENHQKEQPWFEHLIGPGPVSVSKVNQWVSLFTIVLWAVLAFVVLPPFSIAAPVSIKHTVVTALTILFTVLLLTRTRTHLAAHRHHRIVKESYIADD